MYIFVCLRQNRISIGAVVLNGQVVLVATVFVGAGYNS